MSPFSGGWLRNYSGCFIMNWFKGLELPTSTVAATPCRLPARPLCCQVLAMVPG